MKEIKEILFKIFIWSSIRTRVIYNEDFKCKVREEKYRIIHPLVFVITFLSIFYYLIFWWMKAFIEDIKNNICIY